jgi:hypothetical protein
MSEAFSFALLAVFVVLLAAMPWRRPSRTLQNQINNFRNFKTAHYLRAWLAVERDGWRNIASLIDPQ